mgnify:CR=1 FL=1
MEQQQLENIIEAALLASGKPLTVPNIEVMFESEEDVPSKDDIRAAIESLGERVSVGGCELVKVASGYRLQVKQDYAEWVSRLWEEKSPRYSRAMLETLALIAYRQPITRGEIEQVRGVAVSSNIIRTLLDRDWVRIIGHKEVPGRPAMYATTKVFLDYFNLSSLNQLPSLNEIHDLDAMSNQLQGSFDEPMLVPGELDLEPEQLPIDNDDGAQREDND